jgi:hypothetical protein
MRTSLSRLLALLACLTLLVSVTALSGGSAHAQTRSRLPAKAYAQILPRKTPGVRPYASAPPYTISYYESSTAYQTLQSQGCSAAKGPSGLIVLDFGQPDYINSTYGTYDFGGNFDSNDAIFHAVANFAYGAWNCRISSTNLAVAIGTSNYYTGLAANTSTWYTAGQDWGNLINNEQNYISSSGYSSIIGIYGADDIEVEWASYSLSSNFVDGYNNASSRLFFDYGDASPGYWTSYQLWYVAYGATDNLALPEIYYNADATQDWEPLSVWACNNEGGPIIFKGTMAEPSDTANSPAQAWTAMYNAMGSNSCTASVRSYLIFSTSI